MLGHFLNARKAGRIPIDDCGRVPLAVYVAAIDVAWGATGEARLISQIVGVLGDRAKIADFWCLVFHCTSQCS